MASRILGPNNLLLKKLARPSFVSLQDIAKGE